MGYHSDDEGSGSSKSRGTATLADQDDTPQFRNFRPKSWDAAITAAAEDSHRTMKAPKPTEDDTEWTKAFTSDDMKEEGEEGTVSSRREVVIKVRRTAQGLERQRIERIIEEWRWDS